MTRPAPRCAQCGEPLPPGGVEGCPVCGHTGDAGRNRTLVVSVQPGHEGVAAEPADDDLARVPLPPGWEVALDIVEGNDAGHTVRIERSRVLIGRAGVDVPLDDARVSRRHASLEVYGPACILVKDLGSTNGTYVNGRRIAACELADGDEIQVGGTRMTITIGTPPGA